MKNFYKYVDEYGFNNVKTETYYAWNDPQHHKKGVHCSKVIVRGPFAEFTLTTPAKIAEWQRKPSAEEVASWHKVGATEW